MSSFAERMSKASGRPSFDSDIEEPAETGAKRKPTKKEMVVGYFVMFVIASFLFSGSGGSSSSDCNETVAFVMSQERVKQFLKSPSTASFPYVSSNGVRVIKKGECKFVVSAYVDATNSFGATLRNYYLIDVEGAGDDWLVGRPHFVK